MSSDGTKKEDVAIGMSVAVNPKNDRTRTILVEGEIDEILTKSASHEHGMLVRLRDGTVGRVKKLTSSKENKEQGAHEEFADSSSISDVIKKGESHHVEFKTSILWSKYKTKEDIQRSKSHELLKYGQNASKFIIAKSICGLLNSDGGLLIVGVKELKDTNETSIVDIEAEYQKLKDKTQDGYRRMILDEVVKRYFPSQVFNHFNDYLELIFVTIEDKTVLVIRVKPSDFRVFVNIANEDLFFVRIDASTRQLTGIELVDYCAKRFK